MAPTLRSVARPGSRWMADQPEGPTFGCRGQPSGSNPGWRVRSRRILPSILSEILPPGRPVVFLPSFVHSLIVLFGHIEMNQIDPAIAAFRNKGEDQGRIGIAVQEICRTPRLYDQPGRNHGKRRAAD